MLHKNFTGFSLSELSVNVVCSPRYLVKKEGVFGWSERKKNEKTAGLKTTHSTGNRQPHYFSKGTRRKSKYAIGTRNVIPLSLDIYMPGRPTDVF
jgi:hypothetical protein